MSWSCRLLCFCLVGCSHIAPGTQHTIQTKLGQRKYASYPTDELKLRRAQLIEMVGTSGGKIEFKSGSPLAMPMMDDDGRVEDLYKEKNEIERELLRRWKAGDEEARLGAFAEM
jgi:hypothetical protein